MGERNMVTETLLDLRPDDRMPLADFIAMLQGILDKVPPDLRDQCMYVAERGFYDSPDSYAIELRRPETDKEVADREATDARYEAQREAEQRLQYERLKARFG